MNCPICDCPEFVLIQTEPATRSATTALPEAMMVSVVTCSRCSFMYVKRDFNEALLSQFYSHPASATIAADMEAFRWWHQNTAHANRHILRLLERNAGTSTRTLLEVGCGRGTFLYDASHRGWKVTGMEICEPLANFVEQQLRFPVMRCDLKDVGGSYDAIVLFDVLEHIYDPITMLQDVKRLLNPGGLVVIKSPFGKTQLARACFINTCAG